MTLENGGNQVPLLFQKTENIRLAVAIKVPGAGQSALYPPVIIALLLHTVSLCQKENETESRGIQRNLSTCRKFVGWF